MVGNEGTDTNHLRLQFTDKGQVFEQISHCLPGRAYHKASADLITQFFEIAQAAFAVTQFEFCRVQSCIMFAICCFVAQQITVCACFFPKLIGFTAAFANGKCNGTVRISLFYGADDSCQICVAVDKIFATLQNKGPKAQGVTLLTAGKDLFFGQAVANSFCVAASYSAVITVISAVIGEFDQPANIDFIAENSLSSLLCSLSQFCTDDSVAESGCEQGLHLFRLQLVCVLQCVYQLFYIHNM